MIRRINILETVEAFSAAFSSTLHPFVRITLKSPFQAHIWWEWANLGGCGGVGVMVMVRKGPLIPSTLRKKYLVLDQLYRLPQSPIDWNWGWILYFGRNRVLLFGNSSTEGWKAKLEITNQMHLSSSSTISPGGSVTSPQAAWNKEQSQSRCQEPIKHCPEILILS